jgi:dipeptidyl aminopeptidase/acylaminoacyl peptidase
MTEIARYGSWKSPITSDLIVSSTVGLGQIFLDKSNIYWSEGRPSEGGRNVIIKYTPDGDVIDAIPTGYNARTRVHEYGGGSFFVHQDIVYFSNFADQRIYQQKLGEQPQAITPEGKFRYANGIFEQNRDRIICIREDHSGENHEAINSICAIDVKNNYAQKILVSEADFYASPAISPDGKYLTWICWYHPNMPWNGTELWLGEISENGEIINQKLIAGGENESIFQPQFSPDGTLYFVSDRSDWWNIYSYENGEVKILVAMEAEFATPQWVFGMSTYSFMNSDRLIATYTQNGTWQLAEIEIKTGKLTVINTDYTDISSVQVDANKVVFLGASPTQPNSVVKLDLNSKEISVLRKATNLEIDPGYLSKPQPISYPTNEGKIAHAFYYPPQNKDYTAPEGELPPLKVKIHGGPTAATSSSFNLSIQYWTSRGIGILDVNYGGSTGYGREYRNRLDQKWGIVDVQDCENGAKYLVEKNQVDRNRLTISGGSAGGYTTLCALTFGDTFKAGASYYGVSDLEALATDTHKFEARYLDRLIGKYPEDQEIYIERSPIHFTDKLSTPVIFFQGLEDQVVPPNQAEMMVTALKNKKLPVAYVAYEGEQHGFRKAENIKRSLEGELYFYSRVFGFPIADEIAHVPIENLD